MLSLTHLVTREILSLRRKNTKIIAYVIRSPYAGAANKILGNVVTRASYRANSGIWDIETFVPVIDRAGIAWSDYVETDQIGGAPGDYAASAYTDSSTVEALQVEPATSGKVEVIVSGSDIAISASSDANRAIVPGH